MEIISCERAIEILQAVERDGSLDYLFVVTKYIAEIDSIGEDWDGEYTKEDFIKHIYNLIDNEFQHEHVWRDRLYIRAGLMIWQACADLMYQKADLDLNKELTERIRNHAINQGS